MHDAAAMRLVQGLHDLVRAVQQLARREAAVAGHAVQRAALDELHDDEAAALVFAHFVDLADEGVIERGGGQRLAAQPLAGLRLVLHALRQHLDGDLALEDRVVGQVHLAHAALAHEAARCGSGSRAGSSETAARQKIDSPIPPAPTGRDDVVDAEASAGGERQAGPLIIRAVFVRCERARRTWSTPDAVSHGDGSPAPEPARCPRCAQACGRRSRRRRWRASP